MVHPWIVSERKHNDVLERLVRKLGGAVFHRAPFDAILPDGRFVDIKVKSSGSPRHQWRFYVTEEELRFSKVKELWIFFYKVSESRAFLFPIEKATVGKLVRRPNPWRSHLLHGEIACYLPAPVRRQYEFNF